MKHQSVNQSRFFILLTALGLAMNACATSDPPMQHDGGDDHDGSDESPCGNGTCEASEDPTTCPEDCETCGNGQCDGDESVSTCPADCGTCGDGVCSSNESVSSCKADCAGSLYITNYSEYPLTQLYVAPCGGSWSADLIPAGVTIYTYGHATITGFTPGCWNLWIGADTGEHAERDAVQLSAGQQTPWNLY